MPRYRVGLLVDGWVCLEMTAASRLDLRRQVGEARIAFGLVDGTNQLIADTVTEPNGPQALFFLELEDVEIIRETTVENYYQPVSPERESASADDD